MCVCVKSELTSTATGAAPEKQLLQHSDSGWTEPGIRSSFAGRFHMKWCHHLTVGKKHLSCISQVWKRSAKTEYASVTSCLIIWRYVFCRSWFTEMVLVLHFSSLLPSVGVGLLFLSLSSMKASGMTEGTKQQGEAPLPFPSLSLCAGQRSGYGCGTRRNRGTRESRDGIESGLAWISFSGETQVTCCSDLWSSGLNYWAGLLAAHLNDLSMGFELTATFHC